MSIGYNKRRKFATDPAWRASKYIGHVLAADERGKLNFTPRRQALYHEAMATPGISGRLIEQGMRCWDR
jgi:hypothetical protein